MIIREKLQEIYDNYTARNPNEHFTPCGIVNEEAYARSCPKLVYVLREPNDPDQHPEWRLDTHMQGQIKKASSGKYMRHMWHIIGIWSYAIQNNFPKYRDINKVQISAQGLNCIGMTNLKKSGGGAKSNHRDILAYARKSILLWKSELEIMNPDIIICGGTFQIVTSLLGLEGKQTRAGLSYSFWKHTGKDSLLLQIYHPACRIKNDRVYALLKESLLELRDLGLWHS